MLRKAPRARARIHPIFCRVGAGGIRRVVKRLASICSTYDKNHSNLPLRYIWARSASVPFPASASSHLLHGGNLSALKPTLQMQCQGFPSSLMTPEMRLREVQAGKIGLGLEVSPKSAVLEIREAITAVSLVKGSHQMIRPLQG